MPTKKKKKSAAIDKKVRNNTAEIKQLLEMFGLLKCSVDQLWSQLDSSLKEIQGILRSHNEMHRSQGAFLQDIGKSLLKIDQEIIKEVSAIKRTHAPLPIERLSRRSDN